MSLSTAHSSSVAITRPANTTGYGALDVIGRADADTAANAGDAILEFADIAPPGGGAIVLTGASIRLARWVAKRAGGRGRQQRHAPPA